MTVKRKPTKLFDFNGLNNLGVAITNLVSDSRKIKPGDTFVAYAEKKLIGENLSLVQLQPGPTLYCGILRIFLESSMEHSFTCRSRAKNQCRLHRQPRL